MAKSPGDFTGKQKERLQREAQEKQEQEASRLSMITAQEQKSKTNEVIDLTAQKKAKPKVSGPGVQPDAPPVDFSEGGDNRAPEEEGGDEQSLEEVVDATRTSHDEEVGQIAVQTVQPTAVLVRARYDIEQATVGHGNHYTLEAGQRYKLPFDAAQHFAERELVDILQ